MNLKYSSLIGDPTTGVTPVHAWVHTLIVNAMDRDLVPVVGAGRNDGRVSVEPRWLQTEGARRRRERKKDGQCAYWKRELLTLASRSRFPSPFLSIRQGSAVVYSDTSWGTNCVQKGEKFTENPLVKAEVIHYKLILTLIRHEFIPVPVVGTPLMDDLPDNLFQN
jgi:hypothetical protein